jgi:hypothetical protein
MNTLNNAFVLYFGLFLLAALVCAPVMGSGGIIPVLVAGYFMLVSVNAIGRGESRGKHNRNKRR